MGQLFNVNSPFMQRLNQLADIIILNILVVISSIPIITIGAAQTALYDVTGRLMRNEGYVWKNYWMAFKSNFKVATKIWLLFLPSGIVIAFGLLFYATSDAFGSKLALVLLCIACYFWLGAFAWAFPLQSKFENAVKNTLHNAFHCSTILFLRTIIMVAINSIPVVLFFTALPWFLGAGPIWILLWFAFGARINAHVMSKPFSTMVEMAEAKEKNEQESA